MFENAAARPFQLKPSDSAPVLKYGTGLSYNFLAEKLGVNTSMFSFNTKFYFPFSSLSVRKSHKNRYIYIVRRVQFIACLHTMWAVGVWSPMM
jgi:hypothetical protein